MADFCAFVRFFARGEALLYGEYAREREGLYDWD